MIRAVSQSIGPLSRAQAQSLTDRIRSHIDAAWADITKAYEGKAWKALGYSSWGDYVKAEFNMGRSRSYQLLDQGRVIHALADATGGDVQRVGQISARDVDAVKDDLPAITTEIRERVEQGENPKTAIDETVAAARAEKERQREDRKAKQAENEAARAKAQASFSPEVQAHKQAKAEAIAARKEKPDFDALMAEVEQLRETNAALEADVERLTAEISKFDEMRIQYEKGGFESVIAGKDDEIRALLSRVERESGEKVRNLRSMEWWRKKAFELGYTDREVIEING